MAVPPSIPWFHTCTFSFNCIVVVVVFLSFSFNCIVVVVSFSCKCIVVVVFLLFSFNCIVVVVVFLSFLRKVEMTGLRLGGILVMMHVTTASPAREWPWKPPMGGMGAKPLLPRPISWGGKGLELHMPVSVSVSVSGSIVYNLGAHFLPL